MKAIDYINKNLPSLNRVILDQLLGNESVELTNDMWEYLCNTPWNTNKAILKSNWGLDLNSEEDGGEWTTIRLEWTALAVPDGEGSETTEYWFGSINTEDIIKYKELSNLWKTNQHPIIKLNGMVRLENGTDTIFNNELAYMKEYFDFEGWEPLVLESFVPHILQIICYTDEYLNMEIIDCEVESMDLFSDNYIEIQYKTEDYYTITMPTTVSDSIAYVSPNSSWTVNCFGLLEKNGAVLFDGTNVYHEGDIIQFTNDMILEVIPDSDSPIDPGDNDDEEKK